MCKTFNMKWIKTTVLSSRVFAILTYITWRLLLVPLQCSVTRPQVAAHFPHLVAIASTSEPSNNRSWSPTALFTETVHATKLKLVYFFEFIINLEVVGDNLPDETNAVFIVGFRNLIKYHVPTSAVYFLSDQLVILVGLFLLAFRYAVEGF